MSETPNRPAQPNLAVTAVSVRKAVYVEDAGGRRGWVYDGPGAPLSGRLAEGWVVERLARDPMGHEHRARQVCGGYPEARDLGNAHAGRAVFPSCADDWLYDAASGRLSCPAA